VANVGVGAPTPNDDEGYAGICLGTTKDPDDKKPVCCSMESDCDNAFQVTGQLYQCQSCASGASMQVTHPDGTTAQVQCSSCAPPRPAPQPPLPTPPSAADYPMFKGAFYIDVGAKGNNMPFQSPQGAGICFQGAASYSDNPYCNPPDGLIFAGTIPTLARGFKRDADPKWYNIGGGGDTEKSQIGCAGLKTYSLDTFKEFKTAGYSGIYYDVEVFAVDESTDATQKCFADSFSNAKLAQLQVMLGTSYTAPYKSVLPGDQGKTDSDNLFKEIMQDPHVDVLAPQFYGDGTNAHIIPTDQSSIQLMDWGTLSGDKPVQPTLLLASMDDYSTQKKQFEAACNSTPPLVPKKFCESGYWVYQNPKKQ
jgi:hypothetical protein